MKVAAVLLAAGQGTRMRSALPKVLHTLCGKPMLWHALEALRPVSTEKPVIVVGHGADQVRQYVGDAAECVLQEPQLGTAHAAMQAEAALKGRSDLVIVSYADMPLLRPETFTKLVETQRQNKGPVTMMSVMADDPRGFGRVVRSADGTVQAIVEEYVATPEQLQIHELNVGAYCFEAAWLWDALKRIQKNPKKGEYYLTDIVELATPREENRAGAGARRPDRDHRHQRPRPAGGRRGRHAAAHQPPAHAQRRQPGGPRLHLHRAGGRHRRGHARPAEHAHPGEDGHRQGQRHRAEQHHPRLDHRRPLQGRWPR